MGFGRILCQVLADLKKSLGGGGKVLCGDWESVPINEGGGDYLAIQERGGA